jgi:hypothetical protein
MDIQAASINMSQSRLREDVGVRLESMSLDAMKEQAAALDKLMQSAEVITDPNLGSTVDISA